MSKPYVMSVLSSDVQLGLPGMEPDLVYHVSDEYSCMIHIVLPDDQVLKIGSTPDYKRDPVVYVQLLDLSEPDEDEKTAECREAFMALSHEQKIELMKLLGKMEDSDE